jgi:hypothetical protein
MTSKINVLAAIALAAIVSVPGASYAASKKHRGAASTDTGKRTPPSVSAVRAPVKIRTV